MARVKVYTSDNCPYCARAKSLLQAKGIAFDEVKLGWDDEAGWDALTMRSGMKTVPQIFVSDDQGERLIGGFQQLSELDGRDGLASLK